MKNSNYILMALVLLAVAQLLRPGGDAFFISVIIFYSAFHICQAIEKNGKDK